jgi:hypothetical protein
MNNRKSKSMMSSKISKLSISSLKFSISSFKFSSYRFLTIFIFILIFSSLSFASECLFGSYLRNGVCVPDYLVNLSTTIMLVSILIASVFYMIGIALEHVRIIQWSKDILFQILGTALILGVYLGLAASLDFWAPALLGTNLAFPTESTVRSSYVPTWEGLHSHVTNYVNCLIRYTNESVKSIVGISSAISVLASTSINLEVSSYNQFFTVAAAGSGLSSFTSLVLGALAGTLIQLRLQLEILGLSNALFTIVLPLGLIFRSFPYTRGAGAAMIAIVFGFTIFLPLFYLIIEDIGYHYYPHNACIESAPSISLGQLVGLGFEAAKNGVFKALVDYFGSGGIFEGLVKITVIQATVLPLVAYLVVLNITKRIAEILGGEIDFSTLVRLI